MGEKETETAKGWKTRDRMITFPNKGSARYNWKQNASILRREMAEGKPIYDLYREADGELKTTKGFLNAERNMLRNKG